jgi:Protein of unknown function (DUF2281)
MSLTTSKEKIALLPEHLKSEVNNFIDFLLFKENKKSTKKEKSLSNFIGILSNKEAEEFSKGIIDCRQIDLNQWK